MGIFADFPGNSGENFLATLATNANASSRQRQVMQGRAREAILLIGVVARVSFIFDAVHCKIHEVNRLHFVCLQFST